jgi:hypothetical protein
MVLRSRRAGIAPERTVGVNTAQTPCRPFMRVNRRHRHSHWFEMYL